MEYSLRARGIDQGRLHNSYVQKVSLGPTGPHKFPLRTPPQSEILCSTNNLPRTSFKSALNKHQAIKAYLPNAVTSLVAGITKYFVVTQRAFTPLFPGVPGFPLTEDDPSIANTVKIPAASHCARAGAEEAPAPANTLNSRTVPPSTQLSDVFIPSLQEGFHSHIIRIEYILC